MRIRLSIVLFISILLFAPSACSDQTPQAQAIFYQGNAYYSEEKFEEAVAAYEKVLDLGLESGYLYYNLGNAYFKQGFLGKAILNYLRAQRLIPEDADLKSNLYYARSLIKSGPIMPRRRWLARIFFGLAGSFSLNNITLFSATLYFIITILVIISIKIKRSRKILSYIIIPAAIALVIGVSIFSVQYYKTFYQKEAVVIVERSDCKFEPLDGATTFFTLYEGSSVVKIGSKKEWVKIRRPDGKQGWIRESDIELL